MPLHHLQPVSPDALEAVLKDVTYLALHGHFMSSAKRFGELRRVLETSAVKIEAKTALDEVASSISANDVLRLEDAARALALQLGFDVTQSAAS